jgi:simple sugar transport system ATP-binding protein
LKQRSRGAAILYISTELDEILNLSDRIAVIHRGEIMGIVRPDEVTPEELGLMMAGTHQPHQLPEPDRQPSVMGSQLQSEH